jgi:Z1 domain
MSDLENFVVLIAGLVRGGFTPADAVRNLSQGMGATPGAGGLLRDALVEYERRTGRIRSLKEPASLQANGLAGWYPGPSENDHFWPPLHHLWIQRGWPEEAVTSVDTASSKVVSLLRPPGLGSFSTRGLVLGYVQSGKTANFTAVIAKAADVGYKFFVVLSGIHNLLRTQTQVRLERELVDLNPEEWVTLTTSDRDFSLRAGGNADAFLTTHHDHRVLCVVKKNATILRRLLKWLRSARAEVIARCPVLMVDDEADQASVNASGPAEERTRINRLILDILETLPKAAYIGYTATPFANMFIEPSVTLDLYPRDFIVDLPQPRDYFGAERIFGREPLTPEENEAGLGGLDVIRRVQSEEVRLLKPRGLADYQQFEPDLPASLQRALRYFWLATAARAVRGQASEHSTMLIHTTLYAAVHDRFRPIIERYRQQLVRRLEASDGGLEGELRSIWEEEQARVPSAEVGLEPVSFQAVLDSLAGILTRTEIVVENNRSAIRLDYGGEGRAVIVIGGNTLSRGLTLEGLVVSYFVRAATAYDTLLQMGRWFGYRAGYADLPRIWLTEELEEYFFDLATVEREIRNDIQRYEIQELKPLDFGPRIRTHPALSITSELKMQAAIDCDVSYGNRRVQTILFAHRDPKWLRQNLSAGRDLLRRLIVSSRPVRRLDDGRVIYCNVPSVEVVRFLRDYAFHPKSLELRGDLLRGYIEAQNRNDELGTWNVAVITRRAHEGDEPLELTPDLRVPLLNRSRIGQIGANEYANLGVIMSNADIVADLDVPREAAAKLRPAALQEMRPRPNGPGLLLLYPIDRDSQPAREPGAETPASRVRYPLKAIEHVLGIGLVFPVPARETPQRYMTVDLSKVEREELEVEPEVEDEEEAS